MENWVDWVKRLAGFARASNQTAYARMKISLQQEWNFVQRVTPGIGTIFASLDASLRYDFFPDMLGERIEEITDFLHKQITWAVKQAGIGIPDPNQTVPTNFETLEHCYEILTPSTTNGEALNLRAHTSQVRKGRDVGMDSRVNRDEGDLRALKITFGNNSKRKV